MGGFSRSRIIDLYRNHPLTEERLLTRVLSKKDTLSGITEMDLAKDPETGITDQNHVGGLGFVKQLARRAGVHSHTPVLDLGCGLGGSARSLAYLFGCAVHGVELSPERCESAQSITTLVGLDHLVTFSCGDFLTARLPHEQFSIVWGQGAWVHASDIRLLLRRCSQVLRGTGNVAFEEAYLKNPPIGVPEKRAVEKLEELWAAQLVPLEGWIGAAEAESFSIFINEDLSVEFTRYYSGLLDIASKQRAEYAPESEVRAWHYAVELSLQGIIGYTRLVAEKTTT